jgi:hypothetical protein
VIAAGNGTGSAANQLNFSLDMQMDTSGNIYVADGNNNRVQRFSPTIVNTISAIAPGTYTATVTPSNGCPATTGSYTINPLPLSMVDTSSPKICVGDTVSITASSTASKGNALDFTGTNGTYASIPAATSNSLSGLSNFTVSAWVYPRANGQQNILFKGLGCSSWHQWQLGIGGAEPGIVFGSGKWTFSYFTGNGSGLYGVASTNNVVLNQWSYVTASYDGSKLRLYVNGVLENEASATGVPWASSENLFIGQDPGCGGRQSFDGRVDEISIWNATKTQADIGGMMSGIIPSTASGLLSYYRFDENNGTKVYDMGPSAQYGTLTGTNYTRQIPSTAPVFNAASGSVTYGWSPATGLNTTTGATVNASPTSNQQYTITTTHTASGCTNIARVAVDVNALPTANVTPAGPVTTCASSPQVLTADSALGYSWQWFFNGGIIAGATGRSYTPAATGSYTVMVTNASGCFLLSSPVAVTIVSNVTPSIAITSSPGSPICSGTSVTFTATPANGGTTPVYQWLVNGIVVASGSTYTSTTLTNGATVQAKLISNATCRTADTVSSNTITMSVNATPAISSTSLTNPTTCGGTDGSITLNGLTAGTAYTVYYTANGTAQSTTITANGSGQVIITGLSAGSYTNLSVATAAPCSSNVVAGPVTLSDPATPAAPTVTNNGPLCSGATLNLGASTVAGATYSWTGPNGFSSLIQNPSIPNVQVTTSGTYSVTVTVANCTSAPGSTTVVVNQMPALPTASSNSPLCSGNTLNLNAGSTTPGVSYSWSGPSGFSSGLQNPSIASATTSATGTYTVTVTNANATCSTAASVAVVVNQTPSISGTSFSDPTTCNGTDGSITLSGLGSGGVYAVTYTKNSAAPVTVTFTANGSGDVIMGGLSQGSYSNISVMQNNCQSNIVTGPITLSDPPIPLAPVASSNSPVCQGSALSLSASGQAGATYSWSGPNSYSSSTQSPTVTTNMQSVHAGTYSVTQTVAGCVSPAATTTVVMSTVPAAPGAISGNSAPCAGLSYTYSIGSVPTATSYVWTIPSAGGWSGSSATTSLNLTTGTVSGTLSVAAVNGCGQGPSVSLALNVNTIPATPSAISGPATICSGASANYAVASISNATAYNWSLPAAWTGGTATTSSILATASPNSGTISVTASNVCGTSAARSLGVTVISIPAQPGTISGSSTPCVNSTQTYSIGAVSGATSYTWTYPSGGSPSWLGGSTASSINLSVGTNSGNITVAASNVCGTSPARSLGVTVTQLPGLPGAITGKSAPCVGSVVVYKLASPSVGASYYSWTYPSTWSGAGTQDSLTAVVGTGTGTITVTPVGVCGAGPSRTLSVATTAVVTSGVTLSRSSPSDTICANTPVTFTATPTGGGSAPQYVFRKNGVVVPSAGNSYTDYRLSGGDVVSVTMASSLPCVTNTAASDSIRMVVIPQTTPGININATPPVTLCAGASMSFTTNIVGGGSAPAYQWYRNGLAIAGATAAGYTSSALSNGDTLQVMMVTSALCPSFDTAYSNKVGLSVASVVNPTVTISSSVSGPYVPGTPITFSLIMSGGGLSPAYQWLKNGVPIPGETGLTYYAASGLALGDQISVRMQSSLSCAVPSVVVSNIIAMQGGSTSVITAGGAAGAGKEGGFITLYPNPNSGVFTISGAEWTGQVGKRVRVELLSALGQIVYRTELAPTSKSWTHQVWLDEAISSGTYLLRISTEDGSRSLNTPVVITR